MRNLFQRAGNAVRNVAGRIRSAFLAVARVPPAPDLVVSCDWRISWHDTQRFNLNLNSWPSVACRVR